MPLIWPPGSIVVLLNSAVTQIDLAQSARGLARNYRIGAASRGVDDPNVVHRVEAFSGIGIRPYSPAHLKAKAMPSGDIQTSWIRRTRIDGDTWESYEVPLGEVQEQYLVRIISDGNVVREVVVVQSNWTYTSVMQAADGTSGSVTLMVAQISDRFGPGLFSSLSL
jgi:hypothetical protein